ncbi:MAG: hypothetical protein RBR71_12115 [Gudongella sp.]|nr:hypothetical protein [Gudongella sp.]
MEPADNYAPVLADRDTQEAVVYGTAYALVKAVEYNKDRVVECLDLENAAILEELDLDLAEFILENYPNLPYSECDYSCLAATLGEQGKDITSTVDLMRSYNRNILAKKWFGTRVVKTRLAARRIGAVQHGIKIYSEGYQEETWSAAAISHGAKTPISYDAIRGGQS